MPRRSRRIEKELHRIVWMINGMIKPCDAAPSATRSRLPLWKRHQSAHVGSRSRHIPSADLLRTAVTPSSGHQVRVRCLRAPVTTAAVSTIATPMSDGPPTLTAPHKRRRRLPPNGQTWSGDDVGRPAKSVDHPFPTRCARRAGCVGSQGPAETKRSVRRYARRASSSRSGWAMPSSRTGPSSTKLTPRGDARSTTPSLTRTRPAPA
jgi:hypothetical protein